ncbi:hypothetical protein AAZX31_18G120800 [Glycine max]|uniref:Uncharacterized protein n=2 Tax=Glycine subgen. Soja TaxID=1462606 RepID=K7MRR7_SOYBN|nr:transcription factor MYB1R1 [Glycine max]XP_028213734.1 transcription factor MYB1R1-like [Glycine soja]KAG4921227.1 hypothetical protein JHK86_050040 [Glycine max]KAG4924312.1 hypothetical protein JHK87_049852 [Glycine soja]KAG4935912.1 hypothetical protein JHK85_050831 [Glycine max]KAG5091408.1 hypothetical protein JHK82_050186 [Glycine max]KAG5094515.1 hypothetical protein JHK84_050103 [Glycine max]|eukprot:XP_003553216.1 transcription factor MYB1R1 [Glycine max]
MCSAEKDGIMLFGVRLTVSDNNPTTLRKSASMNNLSQYDSQPPHDPNAGYASDDVVHPSRHTRERKRGVPWTEEEHRLFLLGLQNVGKGNWRGISRNFVMTRTPTQVASHAQKYFLRCHRQNRRRRRSSLFDITTNSVMEPWPEKEEEQAAAPSTRLKPVLPVPQSSKMAELDLNGKSLSLKLSVSKPPISNENFGGGGDSISSVA